MSNTLTYPGDHTNFDPDQVYGPDMYGAYYVAKTAVYDAEHNQTTITLQPLAPAELQQRYNRKTAELQATADAQTRLRALFGVHQ